MFMCSLPSEVKIQFPFVFRNLIVEDHGVTRKDLASFIIYAGHQQTVVNLLMTTIQLDL
jgi:hypothetical protein